MNKSIYGLALALVLGTTGALANGPNQDHTCQGGHNCNEGGGGSAEQYQGQIQGQAQGQTQQAEADASAVVDNENTNSNQNYNDANASADSNSYSDSDSSAYSGSYSSATGGDANVRNRVGVYTGGATSGSSSTAEGGDGGDATAYAEGGAGGSSSSKSKVGDTTAVGTVSVRGDTVTYEDSAARAASVYTAVCENGGSAQAKAGGFAIVNQDVVCEHLKIAAFMREAYMWEMNYGSANCQATMDGKPIGTGDVYSDTCMSEKAVEYYKAYHEHLTEAIQAMEMYEEVGLMDKIAGALVRPMALIGALIWLI